MDRVYAPKILLAWVEAVKGNPKIIDWLVKNGYNELGLFSHALRDDEKSRRWLMNNGFPHLMALINAAEGDENALSWLEMYNFSLLAMVAKAAFGDESAQNWLNTNDKILGQLAIAIEQVIDDINQKSANKYSWN